MFSDQLRLGRATLTTPAVVLALCLVLASGCSRKKSHPPPPSPVLALPEPIIPLGYKKIAPGPVDTADEILTQTAAIIEGDVSDVDFTYDDCAGPRTNYQLTGVKTLAGTEAPSNFSIKILGGPLPNGSWIEVSEVAKLALDSHYVIFLRNTDWTFSPILKDLALRRETIAGREVLVNNDGQAVVGWGENGPLLSPKPVTAAVGDRVYGYRKIPTETTTPSPQIPVVTDPGATVQPVDPASSPIVTNRSPVVSSGSPLHQAPSASEIRAAGLFARPPVFADGVVPENSLSTEALITAVKEAAERGNRTITGRLTLDPLWRCWNVTPTVRALSKTTTSTTTTTGAQVVPTP